MNMNPGGEVACVPLFEYTLPDPSDRNRLLGAKEARRVADKVDELYKRKNGLS